MRWFGQVDDGDRPWKMDVEKVVRQVGLGVLRQYKVGFECVLFFRCLIITLFLAGTCRVTQYRRTSS